MHRRASAAVITATTCALLGLVAPVVADPTVLSPRASGCTVTGTAGDDRLVGTSGPDVICGLGGDDFIVGRGGDDRILGGAGGDTIAGGDGADIVVGGAGHDVLVGGNGADELLGGLAGDVETGGAGRDVVSGGNGNDDLAGGTQADDIDGGPGTNWCTVDTADTADRCVYDLTPGNADQLTLSTDNVNVTAGDREVTVRVHATDDTGLQYVRVLPGDDTDWFPTAHAQRVSGTVRDGWWEATLVFHRWSAPGTFVPRVAMSDRVNRGSLVVFPDSPLTVRDDTPDLELPTVQLLAPAPTKTYDTRTSYADVTVRAHITDSLSGVQPEEIGLVLWQPRVDGAVIAGWGRQLELQSGDLYDGIWSGTIALPRNSVAGDWNIEITALDRAHRETNHRIHWWGPGEYVYWSDRPELNRAFPDNMGSFHILGRARTDTQPPIVTSVAVSPDHVDTLPGPATVHLTVQAADAGRGVDGVYVELMSVSDDGTGPKYLSDSLELTAGDDQDGTWTGSITLPQGIPPGTYYLKVVTWDHDTNMTAYVSSGHPDADSYAHQIASNPTVTVIDSSAP